MTRTTAPQLELVTILLTPDEKAMVLQALATRGLWLAAQDHPEIQKVSHRYEELYRKINES